MSSARSAETKPVRLAVHNVGGIDHTDVSFSPGVTILTGRNATNRTSLLRALMAALGSEHVSLKGDADEGRVELALGDETYMRTLTRSGSTGSASIRTGGEPYLEGADAELADLFALLLETNEARQAVSRGDDLRELIMRPVDTDALQAEIDRLEGEKRDLDREIDTLDSLEGRLPELEADRTDLDGRIEDQRAALDETETDLAEADAGVEETREEKAELDAKLDELSNARSAVENARLDAESERKSIAALRERKNDLDAELGSDSGSAADADNNIDTDADGGDEGGVTTAPAAAIDDIETALAERRDRAQQLETTINELQTIIGFNEDMLEGESASAAVLDALRDGTDNGTDAGSESDGGDRAGALTDQLLADSETVCWTCCSAVERERIEATLDRLRGVRSDLLEERRTIRGEIDDLESEKRDIETQRRQRERKERELRDVEAEIEDRNDRLDDAEAEREESEADVEELEAEVEALQEEEHSELLDLHKQANRLEFELGRLEREREEISTEIESVEADLTEREELEAEREQVEVDLTDLRGRIERIETQAIAEFNDHIETVLELLDYANIERIWLERRETETREGRRTVTKTVFDLHVIRSTDSGTTYEDTVSHLSESEREVTGLVFALAGYLAHDLYESMPFVLLDSLETIDSDRIAVLVDYFEEYADHVVVALLPEDAAALDDDHERITEI
jgi:DNA repair exonuclease SbcCD ATPase subunit